MDIKTILIVDDEELNFHYIELILRKFGYSLLHAKDGFQAVKLYKEIIDIDLILMDLMMPGMDGLEATRLILQMNPTIPIIAITAYTTEGSIKSAKQIGCVEVIAKPFNKDHLISRVQHYLSTKRS